MPPYFTILLMRNTFMFLLLVLGHNSVSAKIIPKVDERVELVSIVFRLSGAPEYCNDDLPRYAAEIDEYFAGYKDHPAVFYAQKLREEQEIGYSAVASYAVCICIEKGRVFPSEIKGIDSLLDNRWTKETFEKYTELLSDFYRISDFNCFFQSHRNLYDKAEQNLSELLDSNVEEKWFLEFFNRPLGEQTCYIGVANGRNNYAVDDPIAATGTGIIIGASQCDKEGYPTFHKYHLFAVIHEFCHHYTGPIFLKYWPLMESCTQIIYSNVKDVMAKQAYGDIQTTMMEWFNNLCVVMYYRMHGLNDTILIAQLQERGFIWTERANAFMNYYLDNPEKYSCIEEFMPQIIGFLNFTADHFDDVKNEFDNRHPYVISVFPPIGTYLDCCSDVDEITITFSQPMMTYVFGIEFFDEDSMLPVQGELRWSDETTLMIPLDRKGLRRNKTYRFSLPCSDFRSQRYYPTRKDFEIEFKTCDHENF